MTKDQPIAFIFRRERFQGEITASREETGVVFKGTEVIFFEGARISWAIKA